MSQDNTTKIAVLDNRMQNIERKVDDLREQMSAGFNDLSCKLDKYVEEEIYEKDKKYTDKRISLMEKIVYGTVGLVLVAFVTAILNIVYGK